ncbi:hypothetical protein V493_08068 [Pseudogymnoascus sp. VKM F-4281 (FW-2241)]|nr:hypothetical protein V493_08068 [Pseudogymnoascus sp. VKM F-4281 (FW-2241)]
MTGAKPGRHQRRPAPGADHVKHRRTRSGCFTCRNRRCDEGRPTCERCKKGSRECSYPETTPSKSGGVGSSKASQSSLTPPSDEYDDEVDVDRLEPIPDEDEELLEASQSRHSLANSAHTLKHQKSQSRLSSEAPSLVHDKGSSPSPSTEGSIGYNAHMHKADQRLAKPSRLPPVSDGTKPDWSGLPRDLQFYLEYFVENVTHHHYYFKKDSGNFFHTSLLEAALRNKSLLYAIVGFSAFQRTLHNPEGKIQDFLQYYNKSVQLLLKSLRRGEGRNVETMYSILQLATIEVTITEYLGDWINLLSHQKAAYSILTSLFTPQSAMETDLNRVLMGWYARFDIFASLIGGFKTVLSQEWFTVKLQFYTRQVQNEPDNILWKIEETSSKINIIAMEMSVLFAKISKGEMNIEQFNAENEIIAREIRDLIPNMDPALHDSRYKVTDFTGARPLDPEDIVNPYEPGLIQEGVLWPINICKLDIYALDLMRLVQTAQILQIQTRDEETLIPAFKICQMFEAVEYWPRSPKGAILSCLASLGIAAIALPRDQRHMTWLRKKFTVVESNGYIYPVTFRERISELFQDPTCMEWWLPNGENYPPTIRSIREFVEERTSSPRDEVTEDLRDMKVLFGSLNLEDDKSNKSTPSDSKSTGDSPEWIQPNYISGYTTGTEHHSVGQSAQRQWFDSEGFLMQDPNEYRPS